MADGRDWVKLAVADTGIGLTAEQRRNYSSLVQGRIWIVVRLGSGTQASQLRVSSREPLAQFGHLVLKPASPQSIELHSITTSQGRIAGYRIGNGRQRVLGTLRARRLLGGDILLERAHSEISPTPRPCPPNKVVGGRQRGYGR